MAASQPHPEIRAYHVVADVCWTPRPGRGDVDQAPPPRRVAVEIQAYTATDAVVQAGLLVRCPGWLLAYDVKPDWGPREVASVVVVHLHPLTDKCSPSCKSEWIV